MAVVSNSQATEMRVPFEVGLGLLFAKGSDVVFVLDAAVQNDFKEPLVASTPLVEGLQHVGFRGEANGVVQSGIACAVSRCFEVVLNPRIRC